MFILQIMYIKLKIILTETLNAYKAVHLPNLYVFLKMLQILKSLQLADFISMLAIDI